MHDPIFLWIVENAVGCYNKYLIGVDGPTAYERVKGRAYHGTMFEFGEPIMHRISGPPTGAEMTPRWLEGFWIGKSFSSDEHFVLLPDGEVIRSRSTHPKPRGTAVTHEDLNNVLSALGGPTGVMERAPRGPMSKEPRVPAREDEGRLDVRSFRIREAILSKFGFTKDCPRCEALRRGEGGKTVHHN